MHIAEQVLQQFSLGPAVRENHALEHATIVLLSHQFPNARLSGISFARGFFVFGDLPTAAVRPAAERALAKLRGNEPELAIHERCGTNLAVTGLLTAAAAMGVARLRKPYNNLNTMMLATTAALVASRPLGLLTQRYITTHTPHPGMMVRAVRPTVFMGSPAHFVETENPGASWFASTPPLRLLEG
ncbi:MAG TPA: DUF6391 domain-containing protein [Ktedonobacterales bacterium]|jgi:hypothetical protein